ncbi:hypothetical protein JTB14_028462 [Gonioctena quinquepunctata]|nr:hypothetical protein JTB14_028462 [Gonioctena quinquepunctata]
MAPIAGKYQHIGNTNLLEFLQKTGFPEDKAKKMAESKPTVTVSVDGDKITYISEESLKTFETVLILGQTVVEDHPSGLKGNSTPTLDGSTLKVVTKADDGRTLTRTYNFSDSGFELIMSANGLEAKRSFKRV